jgi:hypothetical protein
MAKTYTEEAVEQMSEAVPMGRLGQPHIAANAVASY